MWTQNTPIIFTIVMHINVKDISENTCLFSKYNKHTHVELGRTTTIQHTLKRLSKHIQNTTQSNT